MCAITTDIWTENYWKMSILSATIHYINDNFKLASRILFAALFEGDPAKMGGNHLYSPVLDPVHMGSKMVFVSDRRAKASAALCGFMRLNCNARICDFDLRR